MIKYLKKLFSSKELEPEEQLKIAVHSILNTDPTATQTIRTIVFNCKYEKDLLPVEDMTPSELIEQFKKQADQGDNRFLRHYFYRILRKNGDPVTRKLKYRLKRS